MARVFVTGASGFLGGELCRRLIDEGHTVVALTRDFSREYLPDATHIVNGDLLDIDVLRRAITDYEVEHIYHLAAQSIVRICANDPLSAYQANVMGTVNLLEAIRTSGMNHVKSVVVSTSDKAYGHAPPPYTEDTPLMPKYTYEATKACQDIIAQNYFHNYGVPVKVARCSNIYGPGDPNESRLIPNTIKRLLTGNAPVIFTDVAEYVREFVYIDDVIDAFMLITEVGNPGEVFCIGGVDRTSVATLIKDISTLCQLEAPLELVDRPSNFKEIQEQYIDGTKIKALGWNPKYTLEEGLKKTIAFYKEELCIE